MLLCGPDRAVKGKVKGWHLGIVIRLVGWCSRIALLEWSLPRFHGVFSRAFIHGAGPRAPYLSRSRVNFSASAKG